MPAAIYSSSSSSSRPSKRVTAEVGMRSELLRQSGSNMCERMRSASGERSEGSAREFNPPKAFAAPANDADASLTYTSSLPPMKMPVTFFAASMQAEAHSATEQVNV